MQNTDKDYWEHRWKHNQTSWDLGAISPPIKQFIDGISDKSCSILIPGCGNAYEAEYLLLQGFTNITLIDIAQNLVDELKDHFSRYIEEKRLRVLCEDFFTHHSSYDLILEQTFFCAINPSLRSQYALKMHGLLSAGGKVAGVLFDRKFEGGPPFGGNQQEYDSCFKPVFSSVRIEPCYNSAKPRAGSELFIILGK
jgi:hypothetical protein